MPHFLTNAIKIPSMPFSEGDFVFEYEASWKNESLISVSILKNRQRFILCRRDKQDSITIIKCDKLTRNSELFFIKKALNQLQKYYADKIFSSNVEKISSQKKSEYFKDPSYFLTDFKYTKDISIEIGFGSGRHLLYQAKTNKDTIFIGIEIHDRSIKQLLTQIEIEKISNIIVLKYDSRIFLEFIKSNSISNIFIHFPVPWDKQENRRIFSIDFIENAKRILKQDGKLNLRTDSQKYFTYTTRLYNKLNYDILIQINKNLEISSKYEDRWVKQNKDIYDVIFTNKSISDDILLEEEFLFKQKVSLENMEKLVVKKTIIKNQCFVNFEKYYTISKNSGLLRVSFGGFSNPEHTYIEILDKRAKYFSNAILPTPSNIISHNIIKEYLCVS